MFSDRPTFEECDAIRRTLMAHNDELNRMDRVGEWRGQYQVDMMQAMCDEQWLVIQAIPQNSGKTFCASLMTCARILRGQRGVWCYPTMRQGARVAFRRVDNWMRVLERTEGIKRIMPDAAFEKEWENGGSIIVLSLDISAKSGVQGYTLEFGFLDEGHEIYNVEEVAGAIFSRFDLAMQGDTPYGLVCILGVGGPRNSLIVYARDRMSNLFKSFKWDWRAIVADYPDAMTSVDRARATLNRDAYRQFYELADVATGSRLLFPVLASSCLEVPGGPLYLVGIDVGKDTDYTVALRMAVGASSVLELTPTYTIDNILTVPHGMLNVEQARAIADWARPWIHRVLPGGKTCELNGIGLALHEALLEHWPDCGGLHITDNVRNLGVKSNLINELRIAAQNACFAVPAELKLDDRGESAYNHFAGLTYDVDEKGCITWEHSDYLSAAIMALAGTH